MHRNGRWSTRASHGECRCHDFQSIQNTRENENYSLSESGGKMRLSLHTVMVGLTLSAVGLSAQQQIPHLTAAPNACQSEEFFAH
jgi:hypothetical protein